MSESILYYPNIDIQDGPWLRSAALYWDEVCSIVPDENYADFSPELMYLQERGYYRPIYPGDIFVLGDPREFSNAVKHHFASLLRGNLFSLARANKPGYRSRGNKRRIYSPHITSLIHYRKIPEQIIDLFVDSDVVVVRHDGWLEMDEAFANRYMKLLAEFVTKCDEKDMVLGSSKSSRICEIYPRQRWRDETSQAISLTLEKCLPIPAADVGFERLLDFKEEHRAELLSLQLQIAELEEKISRAQSVEEIKHEIVCFRKSWELELAQAERLFRGNGIRYALGSLRSFVQDAGAVAGLIQWAEGIFQHIPVTALGTTIGMSGLIGVGTYAINYRDRLRAERDGSGFAYIVSANKAGLLSSAKQNIEIV